MTAFDPTRFLIVHGVPTETWAKRWGLTPFEQPCFCCGRVLRTTEPIAQGEVRGLRAPFCECGDLFPPYCVVRADGGDFFSP